MKFFQKDNWTPWKIVAAVWIVFSMLYVAVDLKHTLYNEIYQMGNQQGFQNGQKQALSEIITRAERCEQIPLFWETDAGRQEYVLENVNCPE